MHASFEDWLHGQWAKRGALAVSLLPLSWIYSLVCRSRADKITPVELPVPVVVVGNIYVGGTGKTPITIQLVRELRAAGFNPGVISRGYGRKEDAAKLVNDDSPAAEVGDEPLLIRKLAQCPAAVGRDRVAAAKLLLAQYPKVDVIVSDDGLQHKRLARDMEIAVIGARGLGNGWTMPAGPLREPPSRLDTVDALVMNATTDTFDSHTPRYAATSQLGMCVQLATGRHRDIDELSQEIQSKNGKTLAAAGIAAPDRFFAMLRAHDIEGATLALGDHYDYQENPFADWKVDYIFITGKDAVKCKQIPALANDPRIWVAELEMQLDPYLVQAVIEKVRETAEKKKKAEL